MGTESDVEKAGDDEGRAVGAAGCNYIGSRDLEARCIRASMALSDSSGELGETGKRSELPTQSERDDDADE